MALNLQPTCPTYWLIVGTLLFSMTSIASAQNPQPRTSEATPVSERTSNRYRLKNPEPPTGSNIDGARAYANQYPLDRAFSRFTPEEKAALRAEYEDMDENDEPPFPQNGFGPIINEVARLIPVMGIEGYVQINATIDKQGNAVEFELIRYPDAKVARSIAYILSKEKYKPGICKGEPCAMQLPVRLQLVLK